MEAIIFGFLRAARKNYLAQTLSYSDQGLSTTCICTAELKLSSYQYLCARNSREGRAISHTYSLGPLEHSDRGVYFRSDQVRTFLCCPV